MMGINSNHQPNRVSNSLSGKAVLMVMLKGSRDTIHKRMNSRKGHFMPASLLDSQLETLELPSEDEANIIVDINKYTTVDGMVYHILNRNLLTQE